MSCGATYGIVPFISKRALGVVSGFVGAGGNTIAAIVQYVPAAGAARLRVTGYAFKTLLRCCAASRGACLAAAPLTPCAALRCPS